VIAAGRWFSPVTPVSSTNKTDLHDIAEILLKVVLNTTTLTNVVSSTPRLSGIQTYNISGDKH
jgi:hypothetical protein